MEEQDAELVAKIRARDANALGEFISARRFQLLAYIERRLGPGLRKKVESEDMLQELSAEAIRSLPVIDLAERDPFSWLCQLAERRIIDAHRRFFGAQKRDAEREVSLGTGGQSEHAAIIDLLVASLTTPTQALSRQGRESRLFQALAELPDEQREALRLRYVEGLASKEIAARLGKSDGSVRVMLTRALGRLQQIMGPEETTG